MDIVKPVVHYQVSRSLPDLRGGPLTPAATVATIKKNRKRSWRNVAWKRFFKRTALVLLVLVLLIGGWLGYKFIKNANKTGAGFWSLFVNSRLKGEDQGRVTILLAGVSSDDPGHAGGDLTDSIMLVSLDTKNKTAFMLSIPRDLLVNIPDNGYSKINAAYELGNQQHFNQAGLPADGMGLLESIIQDKFNIPIDYYALINYTAFKQAVDAVGGVEVAIKSPDPRGLYDPFTNLSLPNGMVSLNGQQALNLARARGDGPGSYGFWQADFDRTGHQRQLLVALKDKSTSLGVFANPVKLGNLSDAIGNNVKTDMSLGNIRRLYSLGKGVDNSKITSSSLNDAYGVNLLMSRSYYGQSTLIPALGLNDYSAIQAYVAKLAAVPGQN
jgi:LCP family protein required for cell wall assembly